MTEKAKKRTGSVIRIAVFVIALVLLLWLLQLLVVPKYMDRDVDGGVEGSLPGEYYKSQMSHDVLFFGDCEFYQAINPAVIWDEKGITSYVRGSSQQLIWHSYYMLLESLELETPKVVVFNAVEMKIGKVTREEYTRLTLDGLRLSKYKLEAARASLTEGESLASYIFPILRYHSRWKDLGADDFRYMFGKDRISLNGYLPKTGTVARTSTQTPRYLTDPSFPDVCWEYLDKMREECESRGIAFVILKTPTNIWQYPWYPEWEKQMEDYAREHSVLYINLTSEEDMKICSPSWENPPEGSSDRLDFSAYEAAGLDRNTDSFDGGYHVNTVGAEKISRYIAGVLAEKYGVENRKSDASVNGEYDSLAETYFGFMNGSDEKWRFYGE